MTAIASDPDHVIEELDKGALELVSFFCHLAFVSSRLIELWNFQLRALGTG
ncbi:hypothetical protein E0K89_019605 [Aquicoccus sp. SCR17]|nr:hypothetical protein [Carideicomes alvinocaridis]